MKENYSLILILLWTNNNGGNFSQLWFFKVRQRKLYSSCLVVYDIQILKIWNLSTLLLVSLWLNVIYGSENPVKIRL